jgi:hypothetical protein
VLLGVAIAVLAAGAGVTAAILMNGFGAPAGGDPAAQQATTSAVAAPAPAAPTSTTGAPTTTTTAPAAPADAVAFVQTYYGLLPENTDAAWQLLGAQAQNQSNGQDSYEGFWAQIENVSLQNVRQTGEDTVDATVVFTRRDGSTSSEPFRFVMGTGPDGQTIMQSFSSL